MPHRLLKKGRRLGKKKKGKGVDLLRTASSKAQPYERKKGGRERKRRHRELRALGSYLLIPGANPKGKKREKKGKRALRKRGGRRTQVVSLAWPKDENGKRKGNGVIATGGPVVCIVGEKEKKKKKRRDGVPRLMKKIGLRRRGKRVKHCGNFGMDCFSRKEKGGKRKKKKRERRQWRQPYPGKPLVYVFPAKKKGGKRKGGTPRPPCRYRDHRAGKSTGKTRKKKKGEKRGKIAIASVLLRARGRGRERKKERGCSAPASRGKRRKEVTLI